MGLIWKDKINTCARSLNLHALLIGNTYSLRRTRPIRAFSLNQPKSAHLCNKIKKMSAHLYLVEHINLRKRKNMAEWKLFLTKIVKQQNVNGIWFGCFLLLFSLKIKNSDENVFVEFLRIC